MFTWLGAEEEEEEKTCSLSVLVIYANVYGHLTAFFLLQKRDILQPIDYAIFQRPGKFFVFFEMLLLIYSLFIPSHLKV